MQCQLGTRNVNSFSPRLHPNPEHQHIGKHKLQGAGHTAPLGASPVQVKRHTLNCPGEKSGSTTHAARPNPLACKQQYAS